MSKKTYEVTVTYTKELEVKYHVNAKSMSEASSKAIDMFVCSSLSSGAKDWFIDTKVLRKSKEKK